MCAEAVAAAESPCLARHNLNLSSAVHYWKAAATISYVRDALLVMLPTSLARHTGTRYHIMVPWEGAG